MQVFKAFMKILRKLIPSLSIYMIIFLALSFFLSGSGKENKISQFTKNKVNIAVINEDSGTLGSGLKEYLGEIHNIVELKNDKETLQDELYFRNVEYILFIPEDFTSRVIEGNREDLCKAVKVPGSYTGKYLDTQVNQFISTLEFYMIAGMDEKQAVENAEGDLSQEVKINLLEESIRSTKADDYYYFLYLPYIILSIVIMGISPILMTFQTKEINERNLCSALPLKKKNMQLMLGSMITVLGIFILIMIAAFIMYGKYLSISKAAFYIENCISFLLIATGLSFLVSTFVSNKNVLNMITNVLSLGMCFLGGIFVPREVFGDTIANISKFFPTYWYVNAVEVIQDVENKHSLLRELQINIGVQFLFAIAIFSAALAITKLRTDAKKQLI